MNRPPIATLNSHGVSESTQRQIDIGQYVLDYTEQHGHAPKYDEIAAAVGLKHKSAVAYNVKQMCARGEMRRVWKSPRSLEIVR